MRPRPVRVEDPRDYRGDALDGDIRYRAALARALAHGADEPTAAGGRE